MSRNSDTPKIRRFFVLSILGVMAAFGLWLFLKPNPTKLLEQGLTLGRRNPAAGERLVRRAMNSSPGRYPDAEIALCLLLANQGAWEEASRTFERVDKTACRADLLLALGRSALQSNKGPQALEALEAVRRRGTQDSAAALELLIANYREWGQKDNLLAAARELTQLQPDNPRPWALRVELLKDEVGHEAECLEVIREALTCDLPDDFLLELRHRLIEQLIVCGDIQGARRELAELMPLEGESFRFRVYEVDLYRLEGRPHKALEIMNMVFSQARDPAVACLNRGVIYIDLGRFEEAIHDLKRTVAAQPMNATAHFKLAEAYRRLQRDEPARRHREIAAGINAKRGQIGMLHKRLRREPENRQIYEKLAELCRDLGEEEAARQWEQRAARLVAHSPSNS